jgi:ATP-dependent Lhr-like helicase
VSVFSRLAPRLQEAIVARLGWSSLRPVQEQAGEALLAGANAVILAPTAGGKTEASMFPAISQMVESAPDGVGALYIAPIKALLNNQAERLGLYTEMVGLRRFVWHGDTDDSARRKFLKEPAELLMTTPESLEVMLVSQRVDEAKLFGDLRIVVIDEVHALAGSDRGAHLMSVLERIARLSRHDVQRVGLSATVGNPDAILDWLKGSSKRPGQVVDPPKPASRRQLLVVHRPELRLLARDAARMAQDQKSLFFCQSRSITEKVAETMRRAGTTVFVHHSAVSKEERLLAEETFHRGTADGSGACIVCTSTLELGIDVGDLDRVLQADAPATVSSFLQRMGRTGRRDGQAANTTFFCESSESVLQAIALIELAKQGWVEAVPVQDRCWPVIIHQLLTMALAGGGISQEDAWAHLSQVPDFAGISRPEFDRLIRWLLADGGLREASGQLVIGPNAEKRFGRKNFMELFAVFTSPVSYTVVTAAGQPLGSLQQEFVDRLVDGVSSFLLAGRGWVVQRIQHDDRRVFVDPAPRGKQPTWGGYIPQFLSLEVCQKMRDILLSPNAFPYLDEQAAAVLEEKRETIQPLFHSGRDGIEVKDGELCWWTFAGGRINATLRYVLEGVGDGWKITSDNFVVKLKGDGLSEQSFGRVIKRLEKSEVWKDQDYWEFIENSLPAYRLTKFQDLMPSAIRSEWIRAYLLDVVGASEYCSKADR